MFAIFGILIVLFFFNRYSAVVSVNGYNLCIYQKNLHDAKVRYDAVSCGSQFW